MKRYGSIVLAIFFTTSLLAQQDRGLSVTRNSSDSILRNFALVVGISSYPNINRLLYADDDAYSFADYLVDQKICKKNDVTLLIDSIATKANFFKELRKLLDKSGDNDRVFIYFAGHGDVESDIESGFLLTYNCEPNNYPATDAIDISMLEKFVAAFTRKKANVVLITDACRSGNLAGGLQGANITLTTLSRGFQNVIKILSCQPNQLSQEKNYPGGGHGVFTYHLIDGLNGLADKDNDQFISLRELDRYLDEVADETRQQQVPKTEGDPQSKIAPYSEDLKIALLARKDNKAAVAMNSKKRSVSDSSWLNNRYYKEFYIQVRANRLVYPEKQNALYVVTEAEKANQSASLVTELKLELAAILEDDAQKFINKYLRGELSYNKAEVLQQIQTVCSYLEAVEKMIGEEDIRYTEFHVKKLFFDAYFIFRKEEKKQYPIALGFLEKANLLAANQAWILNAMGLLYEELNNNEEAEKSFLKAVTLAPRWSYPWNNLGLFYWNRQQLKEAENAYKKSLELDSTYGFAWNGLGNVLDDAARYEESIEAYRKSIQHNPLDPDPWNGMGNVYFDMGQLENAEEAYLKSIQVDSLSSLSWNGLGNVLAGQQKYDEAEEVYRRSIFIDSSYYYVWNNLAIVMENKYNIPDAEKYYRKAIELNPDYTDAWINLGSLLRRVNKLSEANEVYRKAINILPANADLWNDLGLVYRALDRIEEAKNAFQKGLSIDSSNSYCWYNLGLVYKIQEKFETAADCFMQTIRLDSTDQINWDHLLDCLDRGTDTIKRLYWYEKRFEMIPGDADLAVQIGYLYILLNNPSKAVSSFEKAIMLSPENAVVYRLMATAYALWSKDDKALDSLEKAFQKGFSDFEDIEADQKLDNTRMHPRYKELERKYRK